MIICEARAERALGDGRNWYSSNFHVGSLCQGTLNVHHYPQSEKCESTEEQEARGEGEEQVTNVP